LLLIYHIIQEIWKERKKKEENYDSGKFYMENGPLDQLARLSIFHIKLAHLRKKRFCSCIYLPLVLNYNRL